MQRKCRIRVGFSWYDNRKSKACPESFGCAQDRLRRRIENRKLVGLVAIAFTFVLGVVLAQAQQLGKIFRIGFLDTSTASGSAVLLDAFRQELGKLGWMDGKS